MFKKSEEKVETRTNQINCKEIFGKRTGEEIFFFFNLHLLTYQFQFLFFFQLNFSD